MMRRILQTNDQYSTSAPAKTSAGEREHVLRCCFNECLGYVLKSGDLRMSQFIFSDLEERSRVLRLCDIVPYISPPERAALHLQARRTAETFLNDHYPKLAEVSQGTALLFQATQSKRVALLEVLLMPEEKKRACLAYLEGTQFVDQSYIKKQLDCYFGEVLQAQYANLFQLMVTKRLEVIKKFSENYVHIPQPISLESKNALLKELKEQLNAVSAVCCNLVMQAFETLLSEDVSVIHCAKEIGFTHPSIDALAGLIPGLLEKGASMICFRLGKPEERKKLIVALKHILEGLAEDFYFFLAEVPGTEVRRRRNPVSFCQARDCISDSYRQDCGFQEVAEILTEQSTQLDTLITALTARQRLLKEEFSAFHVANLYQATAQAAFLGEAVSTAQLLTLPLQVNEKERNGNTVLHFMLASSELHADLGKRALLIRALLERGANFFERNNDGEMAINFLCAHGDNRYNGESPPSDLAVGEIRTNLTRRLGLAALRDTGREADRGNLIEALLTVDQDCIGDNLDFIGNNALILLHRHAKNHLHYAEMVSFFIQKKCNPFHLNEREESITCELIADKNPLIQETLRQHIAPLQALSPVEIQRVLPESASIFLTALKLRYFPMVNLYLRAYPDVMVNASIKEQQLLDIILTQENKMESATQIEILEILFKEKILKDESGQKLFVYALKERNLALLNLSLKLYPSLVRDPYLKKFSEKHIAEILFETQQAFPSEDYNRFFAGYDALCRAGYDGSDLFCVASDGDLLMSKFLHSDSIDCMSIVNRSIDRISLNIDSGQTYALKALPAFLFMLIDRAKDFFEKNDFLNANIYFRIFTCYCRLFKDDLLEDAQKLSGKSLLDYLFTSPEIILEKRKDTFIERIVTILYDVLFPLFVTKLSLKRQEQISTGEAGCFLKDELTALEGYVHKKEVVLSSLDSLNERQKQRRFDYKILWLLCLRMYLMGEREGPAALYRAEEETMKMVHVFWASADVSVLGRSYLYGTMHPRTFGVLDAARKNQHRALIVPPPRDDQMASDHPISPAATTSHSDALVDLQSLEKVAAALDAAVRERDEALRARALADTEIQELRRNLEEERRDRECLEKAAREQIARLEAESREERENRQRLEASGQRLEGTVSIMEERLQKMMQQMEALLAAQSGAAASSSTAPPPATTDNTNIRARASLSLFKRA